MDAATTIEFLGIFCFPFKELKIPQKKKILLLKQFWHKQQVTICNL